MNGPRYAYVTNGLVHHRLGDALELLAEHGYGGVALTLGHVHFDPFASGAAARARVLRTRLDDLGLACAVETGAPFLLDARRKHFPSLASESGERRVELLCRSIDIAAALGARVVSTWSGAAPDDGASWWRLTNACLRVLRHAASAGVTVAFEPEPGMLVARIADYERLRRRLGEPPELGLTLDLGHVVCNEPEPVADTIRRAAPTLAHVHVEDMRRGVHEHLMFGDGQLDVAEAMTTLCDIGYRGLVAVELSRHAHVAHETVGRAIRALRAAEPKAAAA